MLLRCRVRLLWITLALCLLSVFASQAWHTKEAATVAHNPRNLLRLHVIAHSDSPADQDLKLTVRDALIPLLGEISRNGRNADDVEQVVRGAESLLIERAESVIQASDFQYPVRVEIGDYLFTEESLAGPVLPPGEYRAVRVIIGAGRGKNWWCVLFPSLSLAQDEAAVGVDSVVSQHVNRDGVPVEVRWRFLSQLNRQNLVRFAQFLRNPYGSFTAIAQAKARPSE